MRSFEHVKAASLENATGEASSYKVFYMYIWQWVPTEIFWGGSSPVLDIAMYISGGYFVWDLYECVRQRDVHDTGFVLHAAMSLIACITYFSATTSKLSGLYAFSLASEISTPLLHIRWFMIQSKMTSSRWFTFINISCVFVFIMYRLIFVPVCMFPTLVHELFTGFPLMANVHPLRRALCIFLSFSWLALNASWALRFAKSVLKKRTITTGNENIRSAKNK